MKKELVRDWMTKDVISITLDTSLPEAHQIMMNEEIRRLPIVDKHDKLLGIVTLGDVRGAQPSPATCAAARSAASGRSIRSVPDAHPPATVGRPRRWCSASSR